MPKVGVNQEPLNERLVFAFDGTDYRVVKCDTDGQLLAALATGQTVSVTQSDKAKLLATVDIAANQSIKATQTTEGDLRAIVSLDTDENVQSRGYGWVNSAWQKNPLLFGYSAQIFEEKSNTNSPVTLCTLNGTVVPAGEIWIVNAICASNNDRQATAIRIYATIDGKDLMLTDAAPGAVFRYVMWSGQITLKAGDNVNASIYGTVAGDDCYLRYVANRIDIDQ